MNEIIIRREGCTAETITHLSTRDAIRSLRRESRATGEVIRVATSEGRHLVVWAGIVKAAR
jgi:hypothetical protein